MQIDLHLTGYKQLHVRSYYDEPSQTATTTTTTTMHHQLLLSTIDSYVSSVYTEEGLIN